MGMFPYAGYEFYKDQTHGRLEKESFEKEVLEASFFLRYLTAGKSDRIQPEALQYAACSIADMYAEQKQKASSGEMRKKSENTDGYSVSYAIEMKDGETFEDFLNGKAAQIARKYLVGTGLLDRKVGCRHAHKCGCDGLSSSSDSVW